MRDSSILTDPILLSAESKMGEGDTGPEGMVDFFRLHTCSKHCDNHWMLPDGINRAPQIRPQKGTFMKLGNNTDLQNNDDPRNNLMRENSAPQEQPGRPFGGLGNHLPRHQSAPAGGLGNQAIPGAQQGAGIMNRINYPVRQAPYNARMNRRDRLNQMMPGGRQDPRFPNPQNVDLDPNRQDQFIQSSQEQRVARAARFAQQYPNNHGGNNVNRMMPGGPGFGGLQGSPSPYGFNGLSGYDSDEDDPRVKKQRKHHKKKSGSGNWARGFLKNFVG